MYNTRVAGCSSTAMMRSLVFCDLSSQGVSDVLGAASSLQVHTDLNARLLLCSCHSYGAVSFTLGKRLLAAANVSCSIILF